jgi:hypothetical protein
MTITTTRPRREGRNMRTFHLDRSEDHTGTSGTGKVAEGVVFSNGWCALTWLTENTSVVFYPSISVLEAIHGHEGRTRVVYGPEVGEWTRR